MVQGCGVMMCYRDKAFCPFYKDCKGGKDCHRALTQEVRDEAEKMKLGINYFTDKPECYQAIKRRIKT